MSARIQFKIAQTTDEFEAIHALNYRTFVEEIPQHGANPTQRLVDRFHEENTYLVAYAGKQLAGMLALRAQRPFSLDAKLSNLDAYLTPDLRWGEIRLLAVERAWRGSGVFAGLLRLLEQQCILRGVDAVVVSATTRQLRLYEHLGFQPFGPLVGQEGAWYQPMHLSLAHFQKQVPATLGKRLVNLLPGPVPMSAAVLQAFRGAPQSHRCEPVLRQLSECRTMLCKLAGAAHAALVPGGGTMANEVVCGQLSLQPGRGLVVSHGEFGERLANHARRARLPHHHWRQEWHERIDFPGLAAWLDAHPETTWLWAVHCETSTGACTDIAAWRALCEPRGVRLCLDCVSSLGALDVNLTGVYLASGTSGKGLAALAGIGVVFHAEPVGPTLEQVPRALDLALYATPEGVPFTLNTNLLAALHTALATTDWTAKLQRVQYLGSKLREALQAQGVRLAAPDATAVLTVEIPPEANSLVIADQLERLGWLPSSRSGHLQARGWLQFCLLGEITATELTGLPETLGHLLGGLSQRSE